MAISLRLHSQGAVQSDDLAVEHGVLQDGLHELSVLIGVAEALGEGHRGSQFVLHLVGETCQHWGEEQTGGDGADADAVR